MNSLPHKTPPGISLFAVPSLLCFPGSQESPRLDCFLGFILADLSFPSSLFLRLRLKHSELCCSALNSEKNIFLLATIAVLHPEGQEGLDKEGSSTWRSVLCVHGAHAGAELLPSTSCEFRGSVIPAREAKLCQDQQLLPPNLLPKPGQTWGIIPQQIN